MPIVTLKPETRYLLKEKASGRFLDANNQTTPDRYKARQYRSEYLMTSHWDWWRSWEAVELQSLEQANPAKPTSKTKKGNGK